jgi:hypothetical protein
MLLAGLDTWQQSAIGGARRNDHGFFRCTKAGTLGRVALPCLLSGTCELWAGTGGAARALHNRRRAKLSPQLLGVTQSTGRLRHSAL